MTLQDDMQQDSPEMFIRDIRSGELHFRKRVPVAILGSTSFIGQKLVCLLAKHHWFNLITLTGPDELVGRSYGSIVHWHQHEPIPEKIANLTLVSNTPEHVDTHLVFSALEGTEGKASEEQFAKSGSVVLSCVNDYSEDGLIPLIVPEANLEQIELIKKQTYSERGHLVGFAGVPATGLAIAVRPLALEFGIEAIHSVCLQSAPYEERRFSKELERITTNAISFCPTCLQTSIGERCIQAVSIKLKNPATAEALQLAWKEFCPPICESHMPTAPTNAISYVDDVHNVAQDGMTIFVSHLKQCPLFDFKFVISYSSLMKNALLTAEYLIKQGTIFW